MNLQRLNLYNTERTTGKKFGILALVGLMLIPAVLAASFQWTQADATENLDRLEAAVVNLDQPVTIEDQLVPIGRLMVMKLTDKDLPVNIGWTLTDEEDAADGLKSGRFAAVVTIPEDFSANATSLSALDPAKVVPAVLDVETSQAAGVIDPTIGQALSVAITDALNTELTKQFLDNVFAKVLPMAAKFDEAVDGSGKIADGLDQAYDGSLQLEDGLRQIAWGADQVADGNQQLADGLNLMESKVAPLPAKIQLMTDGGHQLADGLNQLNDGVKGYSGAIRDILNQLREINAKTGAQQEQLKAASAAIAQIDTRLADAVQACQNPTPEQELICRGVFGVDTAVTQVRRDLAIDSASALLTQLLAALKDLDYYANTIDNMMKGINKLAWGGNKLAGGLDRLNAGIPQLVDGIGQASDGADLLADGSRQLSDGANLAYSKVGALPDGLLQLRDGAWLLHNGLADAQGQIPDWTMEEAGIMSSALASPVQKIDPVLPDADLSAGYFTALALAIAALVVFMLIRAVPSRALSSNLNAFKLTMQAYWPALVIAALQTVMVAIALQIALHLSLAKLAAFSGVVFVAAAVMMAVSQALVAALGGGGRFIALFAIAVSAPTALISTTPAALQFLVDLTPIAPTIDALRGVITGTNIAADLTQLAVWGVAAIVVTAVSITQQRQVSVKALAQLA